jgi:hypothetical protein
MFETNYSKVPDFFVQKYTKDLFRYHADVAIKWYLVNKLSKCKKKTHVLEKIANEGIVVTVYGKTERVHKSFEWLRKCYYVDLKDNLNLI